MERPWRTIMTREPSLHDRRSSVSSPAARPASRRRPGPRAVAVALRPSLAVGLAAVALAAGACSATFEADELRCQGAGCAPEPPAKPTGCKAGACDVPEGAGDCIGRITTRGASDVPIGQTIALQNFATFVPVGGVEVRACQAADLHCGQPLAAATTGDDGLARLAVPGSAWGGYFEYIVPDMMPALVHFVPSYESIEGDALARGGLEERAYVGPVAPFELFSQVGDASGAPVTLDPSLGFVFGTALGCDGRPMAGLEISLDVGSPNTAVVYTSEGLPSVSSTKTDATGQFYVGNVPADRYVFLHARLAGGGPFVGKRRVISRAGALSVVAFGPSEQLD
jgi:hypothetical protein